MREPKRRRLEIGDELGLPWERWSDGRAWRLKRKRDFGDVHPNLVREAAYNAAIRMGKVVKLTRDRTRPEKYTWIQFADHEIDVGDPCPCGSRRLVRLHPYFARCPQCHSQLLLSEASVVRDSEDDDLQEEALEASGPNAGDRLDDLTDVHLARSRTLHDRVVYRGYGRDGDALVLLVAEFRTPRDDTLNAENAADYLASIRDIPLDHFEGLLDTSALVHGRSSWDLVL